MSYILSLFLAFLLNVFEINGANFVNVCEDNYGNQCCAEALAMHNAEGTANTYWIMETTGSWSNMDLLCRTESTSEFTTRLIVIESRRENDCMIKYLSDRYRGDGLVNYAIGLKAAENYGGVYEWQHVESEFITPNFTNWHDNYPVGNDCVVMDIGDTAAISGRWWDVSCNDGGYAAICERVKIPRVP